MTTPPRPVRAAASRGVVRRSEEGGIALLLVLLLTLVLVPFSTEFAYQVELESRTALNVTDQLKIDNAIDGQFEIMLARFENDAVENQVDSYADAWNADELLERKEDEVEVALTTRVWDEKGKLPLRALGEGPTERRQLLRSRLIYLLTEYRKDTPYELSQGDAEAWAQQIYEYMNKGAVRANIPTPKTTDDRPILILDELDMLPKVRGERFSFLMTDQRKDDKVAAGLQRYVTVYGDGKVNLNTADEILLKAYFNKNPEIAERIVERRDNPPSEDSSSGTGTSGTGSTGTSGSSGSSGSSTEESAPETNPFTDVLQVNEIDGVTPQLLESNAVDLQGDFDVKSNFFSLRIVGETQVTRRDELFVVERVPAANPEEPIEGFRFLLRQERVDPLEKLDEEE
jgi:type II secretory pathway component PulK